MSTLRQMDVLSRLPKIFKGRQLTSFLVAFLYSKAITKGNKLEKQKKFLQREEANSFLSQQNPGGRGDKKSVSVPLKLKICRIKNLQKNMTKEDFINDPLSHQNVPLFDNKANIFVVIYLSVKTR